MMTLPTASLPDHLVSSAVYRSEVHFLVGVHRFTVQNAGGSPSKLDACQAAGLMR